VLLLIGRLQEGNFGSAAFWDWKSAVMSILMPLKLLAGIVPAVPSLQKQKWSDVFGALPRVPGITRAGKQASSNKGKSF